MSALYITIKVTVIIAYFTIYKSRVKNISLSIVQQGDMCQFFTN